MSDTNDPDRSGWGPEGTGADDQGWASTPPPPLTEPPLTLDTETEVSSGGSGLGGRVAAGVIGVLLLVGGSLFAVTQLGSSGPGSAEAAVDELLGAASDEDVLGVLAALDPGERDTLRDSVESLFGEFERLEVVDDSFELSGIDGVDLVFSDVTYRTEPVRDGLARVYFTGGTVTAGVNTDELPIGDFVNDTIERFDGDISGVQESETTEINADGEAFLVAREGGDGWRVSIGYTLAEIARHEMGQPLPTDSVEPVGAESPEAAVAGMANAVADLDLRGGIARLSPNEFGALQEYAALFLGEAEAALDETRSEVEISLDDLQLRSEGSGDGATVFVETISFSARATDGSFGIAYDGECATIEGDLDESELAGTPFEDGEICTDELENQGVFGGGAGMEGFEDMFAEGEVPEFPEFETPEIGITTEQVDGQWYVAPIATGMDAWVAGLEVLEREHLDAMVDFGEALVESFSSGFDDSFSEFEEMPGDVPFDETIDGSDLPPPTPSIPESPTTTALGGQGGTNPTEAPGPIDEAALEEFVGGFAFDDADADCIIAGLEAAGPYVRWELADSYVNGYAPSIETQDAFFAVLDACA
ncbi:MAG: hypothetical protein U5K30_17600 [Acidimicrobiales bacterium]|nr:hypothetical protein [Acidimicrobiales bacterium]